MEERKGRVGTEETRKTVSQSVDRDECAVAGGMGGERKWRWREEAEEGWGGMEM